MDDVFDQKYVPEVYDVKEQLLEKNFMAAVLDLCDLLRPVVRFSDFKETMIFLWSNSKTRVIKI